MHSQDQKTILLIEDEVLIAKIKRFGFKVISANSIEKLVEIGIYNEIISLILMDIDFRRGIDGVEAAKQILEKRNIPIVFLASHSEKKIVDKVKEITRYGYVLKNSGNFVLRSSFEMALTLFETTQKLQESMGALSRTEHQLKHILDTVPALIWQKDQKGRYLQVNKAFCRTVGCAEEDILGKTDYDLFPQEIADQTVSADRKILNSGTPEFGIVEQHQKPSGAFGWSRTDKMLYYDTNGHIAGTIGFAMDITERRQAEEALIRTQEGLLLSQTIGKIGHFEWDIEKEFHRWSEQLEALYGLPPGGFDGTRKGWTKYIHPQDRSNVVKAVQRSLETGRYKEEFRIIWQDGSLHWIQATGQVFYDEAGKPLRMVGVNLDITKGKQAEEALRQANHELEQRVATRTEELRKANEKLQEDNAQRRRVEEALLEYQKQLQAMVFQISELEERERKKIASILHDRVGQKLAALSLNLNIFSQLLSKDTQKIISSRMEESQKLVEAISRHTREIISELRPSVLDDFGLVATLHWHGNQFSDRTGISIRIMTGEGFPRFSADLEMNIFRIVQEALTNISKHARADQVDIAMDTKEGRLLLSITDNGCGFAFEGFRPGNGKRGWGLTFMNERVLALDGDLLIQSEPGKGTRITLNLPVPG